MKAPGIFAGVLLLLWSSAARGSDPPANEHVKLKVRAASSSVRPGGTFNVELRFLPAEGIHVNADPPVEFSLDPRETSLRLKGTPLMATDKGTGYLATGEPVRQKIILGPRAAQGQRTVKGTVIYFYCSDSEGWCNRQKQPVEFTIMVKP